MAYTTPTAADLSTFLGTTTDLARASLLISLAEKLCQSVVSPLPDGAEATVMVVAARAYSNPQNVSTQTAGSYSAAYAQTAGGLWLTKRDEATLRRLASGGGAFTIDPTPTGAGPGNLWAQQPETVSETVSSPPFYGDFDQIP